MNIQPKTVLVFCPNWVGDVVMATPVFACLRNSYPKARIVGVIRRYAHGVIEDSPWFDSIIDCDDKTLKGFRSLVKVIRSLKPDMAILMSNSFRCALISKLGNVKKIYGYKRNGRTFLLSDGPKPIPCENGILPVPMVSYYMELCSFLNLKVPDQTEPKLFFSSQIAQKGENLLKKYKINEDDMVIGLNPGAKFGSSKCWSPEKFAKLSELFEEKFECKILLFAGPGENSIAESIVKASKAGVINTGPDKIDLSLLKYIVKRCQLLVTNDTGPRHYAVAFDVPVVVVMGPTDPGYTDANLEKTIVLRKELDCSPCHKPKCPLDHHNCMEMIQPGEVFKESIELLGKFDLRG